MTVLLSPPTQEVAPPPPGEVSLRPAVAADSSFLLELYAAACQDELDTIGWSIGEQRTFVIMHAQTREWELIRRYPQLDRFTVCVDGVPAGRLLISCTAEALHLIDLCLLPKWRGRGIGTGLLTDLLKEVAVARTSLRLRVAKDSRLAIRCADLGFGEPLDCGTEWMLTWTPGMDGPAPHHRGGRVGTTTSL